MEYHITSESVLALGADALILTYCEGQKELKGFTALVNKVLNQQIRQIIDDGEFRGRLGEVLVLHTWGKIPAKRIVLLGFGEEEKLSLDRARRAMGKAARSSDELGMKEVVVGISSTYAHRWNPVDLAQAVVESVLLGVYRFAGYAKKKREAQSLQKVTLALADLSDRATSVGVERGVAFAEAVNLARDLVNTPANILTPSKLAERAVAVAQHRSLNVEVLNRSQLLQLGMGALMAVSKGSSEEPRVIVMRYTGDPNQERLLALIGKGVTFDSGGIQIKPDEAMVDMKGDMAGAAAVIGAMDAIGALRPHCNVVAVIPATENVISGSAYKPGDVLTAFDGQTIEVVHTDAEGRLILADAVSYAKHLRATHMIDVATLTGSVISALGQVAAGLMNNDAHFADEVMKAFAIAGEKVWPLPMFEEYDELIKSELADVKNDAGRPAGAIQGAKFIERFVGGIPWVHLDIAGTAYVEKDDGLFRVGATGAAVRGLATCALRFEHFC